MKTFTLEDRKNIKNYYLGDIFIYGDSPYNYDIGWVEHMSPIEYNVWNDIRSYGLKMYPQYPVLNYFLDFGDPYKKIGIEADSVEWHKDKIKDNKRQKQIENEGWKIYRIEGRLTKYEIFEWEQHEEKITQWEKENEMQGVLEYRNMMKEIYSYYRNTYQLT